MIIGYRRQSFGHRFDQRLLGLGVDRRADLAGMAYLFGSVQVKDFAAPLDARHDDFQVPRIRQPALGHDDDLGTGRGLARGPLFGYPLLVRLRPLPSGPGIGLDQIDLGQLMLRKFLNENGVVFAPLDAEIFQRPRHRRLAAADLDRDFPLRHAAQEQVAYALAPLKGLDFGHRIPSGAPQFARSAGVQKKSIIKWPQFEVILVQNHPECKANRIKIASILAKIEAAHYDSGGIFGNLGSWLAFQSTMSRHPNSLAHSACIQI